MATITWVVFKHHKKADGTFNLPAEEDEEYALQFSFIGYEIITKLCRVGDLGKIVMKEDAQQLEEVVVTSQVLKTFGNKDQLFLTENARKTGNNALDAIASLPQFKQGAGSSELTTTDNKTILILVDGIRSSSRELMLLKADDIKSISYYSNPPARYAHENVGAVIDVATKRKSNIVCIWTQKMELLPAMEPICFPCLIVIR